MLVSRDDSQYGKSVSADQGVRETADGSALPDCEDEQMFALRRVREVEAL